LHDVGRIEAAAQARLEDRDLDPCFAEVEQRHRGQGLEERQVIRPRLDLRKQPRDVLLRNLASADADALRQAAQVR
jgi:hypothetical protein